VQDCWRKKRRVSTIDQMSLMLRSR
jgi:hypothetical protein